MPHRLPWISERLYPPCEIAAIVRLLRDDGVAASHVLRGSGLDEAMLESPACRTAVDQLMRVCRNAMALAPDPTFALRAGARSELPDRGMVGLLLGACDTLRDYATLARHYQRLATPLFEMDDNETRKLPLQVDS